MSIEKGGLLSLEISLIYGTGFGSLVNRCLGPKLVSVQSQV